jgi:hypothetical protein
MENRKAGCFVIPYLPLRLIFLLLLLVDWIDTDIIVWPVLFMIAR